MTWRIWASVDGKENCGDGFHEIKVILISKSVELLSSNVLIYIFGKLAHFFYIILFTNIDI